MTHFTALTRITTALSLSVLLWGSAAWAQQTIDVTSRQISNFKVGSDQADFGTLQFVGGIEMSSADQILGAISSIRFLPDKQSFIAVMDTGHWATGKIERDADGRLKGVSPMTITSMLDKNGQDEQVKWNMDSEGLAIRDGKLLVSFEGKHRVDPYPLNGFETSKPGPSLPLVIPKSWLRENGGLETVVASPRTSPLKGGAVVVAERSFDKDGNHYAAILDGPLAGRFTVKHHGAYSVTDGAYLPNGDLLLLERKASLAEGIGMMILKIKGEDIKPGAVVDGEVLIDVGFGYQIDNMEGLDVIAADDGSTHLIIVSDNNHSLLERNLMLEFKLND